MIFPVKKAVSSGRLFLSGNAGGGFAPGEIMLQRGRLIFFKMRPVIKNSVPLGQYGLLQHKEGKMFPY